MSSIQSKTHDDLVLHQALDARMLKAIEFASIAAELESLDVPADEYLVSKGYISEAQRKRIIELVSNECQHADATQMGVNQSEKQNSGARVSERMTVIPASRIPRDSNLTLNVDDSRYEWLEKFAQGGLGAVWRARDTTVERNVALKEILPKARNNVAAVDQFLAEARITGQLQHPGVVPIYDIGTNPEGCPFYIMKFVEGQTLHDAIRKRFAPNQTKAERQAALRKLLAIYVQICRTVDYAHSEGFIHRDLKPRNIMLGDYGETLVVDWGLATPILCDPGDTVDLANSDSRSKPSPPSKFRSQRPKKPERRVVGTPAYLAPEQARGETHRMDARSDVYSLGVILFEILTGLTPFPGANSETIIDAVLNGEFPAPRQILKDIPAAINSICLKAMQFEKRDRYQTAGQLADDIERFLAGERVQSHPETRIEQAQRVLANNKRTTFAVVCGLCLLSVVVALAAFQINSARREEIKARLAAEVARQAESEARRQETLAKNEAVKNLRSALDAVDTWLLDLSGDLEFYPGMSGKRTQFLENASSYYANLSSSTHADVALQNEAARAAIRGGDVNQLLGRMHEATPLFEAAVTWFEAEANANPTDLLAKKELANALIGRAIAASQNIQTRNDAAKSLASAKQILLGLATTNAQDTAIRSALARASVAQGRLNLADEDPQNAIEQFEEARRRLVDIVRLPDVEPRHVALYHSTLFELSYLYQDSNSLDTAIEVSKETVRSFDRSIEANPTRPDYYEGRMTAWILLGNVREAMQQEDKALVAYSNASDDYRRLVETLHRGEYLSENLVTAQVNRARILLKRNDAQTAAAILAAARVEAGRLIELHGQQPRLLRIFSATALTLGQANVALGDNIAAKKAFNDALLVLQHLEKAEGASEEDAERLAATRHALAETTAVDSGEQADSVAK